MRFAVHRAKFLESLPNINGIVVDACKNGRTHYIVNDSGIGVKDTAAFKAALLEEVNLGMKCPMCGDYVGGIMNPAEKETIFLCNNCKKQIPSELYETTPYVVSPHGIARLVEKSLGCQYCQVCDGGNYRLGKIYGKHVYFGVSSHEGLFNTHNSNIILVVCDTSSVPKGWAGDSCRAIPFTELFYMKRGEIRVADVVEELKPSVPKPRFGSRERVGDRRDEWLEVLAHILAESYNPRDFRKGQLTQSAAARHFKKVHPRIAVSDRTLSRDMDAFCRYDAKTDKYDKREGVIGSLLAAAANPAYTDEQRRRASLFAMEILLKAKDAAKSNDGVQQKLPDTKWSVGADGNSERVLVTDSDSMFREVDRNLRRERLYQ